MRTEAEIREHLANIEKQLIVEIARESNYLKIVAKTAIEVLKWVLEEKR